MTDEAFSFPPGFIPSHPDAEDSLPNPDLPVMPADEAKKFAEALKPKAGKYYTKLAGLYGSIGVFVMLADPVCGSGILQAADQTARSVDRLARENPAIRRIVETALTGSAWVEFFTAHAPIIAVVASHHLPKQLLERYQEGLMSFGRMPGDDGQGPYGEPYE